jgi:hypothetical protein
VSLEFLGRGDIAAYQRHYLEAYQRNAA